MAEGSFGDWLKRRRLGLGLTQDQLARQISCSTSALRKFEAEERRPSAETIEQLADIFNIPPEERKSFLRFARGDPQAFEGGEAEDTPWRLSEAGVTLPAFLDPAKESGPHPRRLFVGRESELGILHAYLSAALNTHGRVVFITGEAGQGKTSLMTEFARSAQIIHSNLIVASGSCNAIAGIGDPYFPFREVLEMLCGLVESRWVAGEITREHAHRLWNLLPETAQALVEEGPNLIGTLVLDRTLLNWAAQSAPPGSAWLKRLHALMARDPLPNSELQQISLFEQFSKVLQRVSSGHPLLILLDDLQWADHASLNLLFHLGRRISNSRILIIGAYRLSDVELGRPVVNSTEDQVHPLKPIIAELKRHFGEIQIDANWGTPAQGRAFIDAVLDSEPNELSEAFREGLYRRTRGHPLFTLELLNDMQTHGNLAQDDEGRWRQVADLDWNSLPYRVEAVIQRYIERLPPKLHDFLSTASVEGEEFSVQVVAQVHDLDERSVFYMLDQELEKRHALVRAIGETHIGNQVIFRYRFSHALFQEYLYRELSPGGLRLQHGEVARAFENLVRGAEDAYVVALAHHYTKAGDREKTIYYSLKAGDQARNLSAHQEAAEHYRRAIGLLLKENRVREAARALMKLALNYSLSFEFELAREAYEDGFRLWQQAIEAATGSIEQEGQTLRVNWHDPVNVDPASIASQWSTSMTGQLFSGLVTIGPDLEVVPEMARSWEVLLGGCKYIFHLREDVHWSDGRPVTAGDFAYSWVRTLDPAINEDIPASLLQDIKGARAFHRGETTNPDQVGVRAIDDTTLEVELEVPVAYFLQLLAFSPAYPVPKWAIDAHGKMWTEPGKIICNGPFQLMAWKRNEVMVLERNPEYRGPHGNVARIELDLCERPVDLIERYTSGELDILHLGFLPPAEIDSARRRFENEHLSGPLLTTYLVTFNVTRPPFDSLFARQAFALSTDRVKLANIILRESLRPATGGLVPSAMPGHTPDIAFSADLTEGRRLLTEAGYPGGKGFPEIELSTPKYYEHLVAPLVEQWRENLGVKIRVVAFILEEGGARRPEANLSFFGWIADYPDPDSIMRLLVEDDMANFWWHNEAYDRLIAKARRLMDQEDRMGLYRQAEKILIEDTPLLPVYYGQVHILLKPWVKEYRMAMMKQQLWKDIVIER